MRSGGLEHCIAGRSGIALPKRALRRCRMVGSCHDARTFRSAAHPPVDHAALLEARPFMEDERWLAGSRPKSRRPLNGVVKSGLKLPIRGKLSVFSASLLLGFRRSLLIHRGDMAF
jgi:hypothetical protein